MDENLKTLAMIYKLNIIDKEPIWFSKLVTIFKDDLTKSDVAKALDKLYDLGLINTDYKKVGDLWTNTIYIPSESETLAREMYEKIR